MANTETYAHHYKKLEEIAQASSQGLEANDVDQLIDMMTKATEHYKFLEGRINEVEKMLGLGEEG